MGPERCIAGGFDTKVLISASSWPKRRKVSCEMARAKPASRGARSARARTSSVTASSGRRLRKTSERMAWAAARAPSPWVKTRARVSVPAPSAAPSLSDARCALRSRDGSRRDPRMPPCSGLMMNMCAVAGLASAAGLSICAAPRLDALQRGREPQRPSRNLRAHAVGFEFARTADRHLHQHRRDRREQSHDQHADKSERIPVAA